jgi:hypothetical protein
MGFSTLIALGGIGLGYLFYGGGYREPAHTFARKLPGLVALVRDKFRIDELYAATIVRPLAWLCAMVFQVVDRVLIDKVLIGGWAFVADLAGRVFRFFQAGDVQRYLAAFAIGLAGLIWIAARPARPDKVQISVEGRHAKVTLVDAAAVRDKLRYSFDFDGDGIPDREGTSPSATWMYSGPARYTVSITIEDGRWQTQRRLKRDIEVKQ